MTDALVSVVIPTYNRAYCLPATLASLQAQSYGAWEALVVDDGSTDDTAATVRALAGADSRIKYHYQRNAGVSAARNAGLRLAAGRWIGFLDSDDAWEPWKLAAQVVCFKALPQVGMVWTDMNAFDASGNLVSELHLRKMYSAYRRIGERRLFVGERALADFDPAVARSEPAIANSMVRWGDLLSPMIYGSLVHTSTVLLSRERLERVGFFDEHYRTGEDYDFHLRTCREGAVALLDAPSIRYRIAGGSDQLTAPGMTMEIATNALVIREAAIARDRSRINLSDDELRQIIAYANTWVAQELVQRGEYARARPYFRRSLTKGHRPPKLLAKAVLCHLPVPWARVLIRALSTP